MTDNLSVSGKAAELRKAFDHARSLPLDSSIEAARESLLALRVAGVPYAVRVSEVSGVAHGRKLVPLPGPLPELLGLVGIRGGILPVYSLAALLGYPQESGDVPWLLLCGSKDSAGFAFREFEGSMRVLPSQMYEAEATAESPKHARQAVREGELVRPLINIFNLLESIRARCRPDRSPKE